MEVLFVKKLASRAISGLLAVVMCVALLSLGASAANTTGGTYGVLKYEIENKEVTITGCDSTASGKVDIPNTIGGYPVTTIADNAFWSATKITGITIPKNVTMIGAYRSESSDETDAGELSSYVAADTFPHYDFGQTSFTWIEVDSNNKNYSSKDGVLFDKSGKTLLACPTGITGTYNIPDGVTTIASYSFGNCALTNITIPDSVTKIYEGAFDTCSNLISIDIPDGVTELGTFAFYSCENLKEVHLGNHLQVIGDGAFAYCNSLTSITIPDSVKELGSAFYNCTGLEQVILPKGITTIALDLFANCNLTSVVIPNRVKTIGTGAFSGNQDLTSVTIPAGVTTIEYEAFYECDHLTNVTIPASVTTIGKYALGYTWTENDGNTKIENFTIYGYADTAAEVYAIENDFSFVALTADSIPDNDQNTGFSDVLSGKYYYDPVIWAVGNNITTGTSATTFSPELNCSRGQIVTFLWRLAGEPEPTTTVNPFTDVSEKDYYYKAVLWAYENGITTGASATTFNPKGNCTRGQIVTFLWRYADEPTANASGVFTDVKSGAYYTSAVYWAVANGITNGMSTNTFVPGGTCTRGQAVTFLYRYAS
jgi:hypothetical protein